MSSTHARLCHRALGTVARSRPSFVSTYTLCHDMGNPMFWDSLSGQKALRSLSRQKTVGSLSRQRIFYRDRTHLLCSPRSCACPGPPGRAHWPVSCEPGMRSPNVGTVVCAALSPHAMPNRDRNVSPYTNPCCDTTTNVVTMDLKSLSRQRVLCLDKNLKMGSSPPFSLSALPNFTQVQ